MRPQERPAAPSFQRIPAISATPRSLLAAILSLACILSLSVELPASAAIPAAGKDKEPKTEPALQGLPLSETSPHQAILSALNRFAYGPPPSHIAPLRPTPPPQVIEHT